MDFYIYKFIINTLPLGKIFIQHFLSFILTYYLYKYSLFYYKQLQTSLPQFVWTIRSSIHHPGVASVVGNTGFIFFRLSKLV